MKKVTIFILFAILFSCRKDRNSNIAFTDIQTDCKKNSVCTYNYYEQANLNGYNQLVAGGDRVFIYKSVDSSACDITALLYFKTSMGNNDFDLNGSQIAAGQAAYSLSCACCYIAYQSKPISGEIKGKMIDASHWLINATVVLGNSYNKQTDTLVVNQSFTFTKLP